MSTVSPDSVAQDQIRAFVERIMRLREEVKAINGDIREVYAEAKGNGFDKTVLGKVVNYIEKRATSAGELAEGEALFDLYLAAFDGATRVGTGVATHTHEAASYDRLTGEVRDETSRHGAGGAEDDAQVATERAPSSANSSRAKAAHAASRGEDVGQHQASSDPGKAGAGEPGRHNSASADADPANNSVPRHEVEEADEGEVTPPASSADTPEPASPPSEIAEPGDRGAVIPAAAPVVANDYSKPNPWCQDPEDCGVNASWNHMCGSCLRRRATVEAAGAVQ